MADKSERPASPNRKPEPDFTVDDKAVQAEMQAYALAVQQEYERAEATSTIPNVVTSTRDFFKKHVDVAAAQVLYLAIHSTSDSVKLNASKLIITEALADARAAGDPIKDLLDELRMNDPASVAELPSFDTRK